jgi:hypothetical protein
VLTSRIRTTVKMGVSRHIKDRPLRSLSIEYDAVAPGIAANATPDVRTEILMYLSSILIHKASVWPVIRVSRSDARDRQGSIHPVGQCAALRCALALQQ